MLGSLAACMRMGYQPSAVAIVMDCPQCGRRYPAGTGYCAEDGRKLEPRDEASDAVLTAAPRADALPPRADAVPPRADALRVRADPLIGRTLDGRYQILERIGTGGMGAVYRARQLNVDRDVAIKVLLGGGLVDPKLVQRFEAEARIISRLRHPGVLKLIDVGWVDEGAPFFVTELLHGESLQSALAAGAMSEARALHITHALADALVEPHAQGIVHRDIKPANVFLEQIGDREIVKLLDFGVAMLHEGTARTTTGNVLGTPKYMSPEQATGERVGPASDLYSLGVLLFECLTGRPPFVSTVPAALLLKHINDAPPTPSSLAGVSPGVDALVLDLMAKAPDARPAGARELSRRIEGLLRERPDGRVNEVAPDPAAVPTAQNAQASADAAAGRDTRAPWPTEGGGSGPLVAAPRALGPLAESTGVQEALGRPWRGVAAAVGAAVVLAGVWWAGAGPRADDRAPASPPLSASGPAASRTASTAAPALVSPAPAAPALVSPAPTSPAPPPRASAAPSRSPRRNTARPTAPATSAVAAPPPLASSPPPSPSPSPSPTAMPSPKAPAGYVPVLTR